MLPDLAIGGEAMFRFVKKGMKAFEQARYLNSIADQYSDPDELRNRALAVIRGQRAESTGAAEPVEERSRPLAA